jgi:ferredoxin-NADP reductase
LAKVLRIEWLTSDVFELVLARNGLTYRAGDVTLLVRDDGVDSRPYSFSSHPDQFELRFLVRQLGGLQDPASFSGWLATRTPGDEVGVGTPFGWFRPGLAKNEVWLATGTGIAPFLSALRGQLLAEKPELYFGLRYRSEAFLTDFLEFHCRIHWQFSREVPSRKVHVHLPGFPLGEKSLYFLCGNGAMIRSCALALRELGVGPDRIHEESFFD